MKINDISHFGQIDQSVQNGTSHLFADEPQLNTLYKVDSLSSAADDILLDALWVPHYRQQFVMNGNDMQS